MIRIKRGLDLPISGAPVQAIGEAQSVRTVAILGRDYIGMKPTMQVQQGDRVKLGQPLFVDKKNPSVIYTSPGAGTVTAINRGYQRRLLSIVIELGESGSSEDQVEFEQFSESALTEMSRESLVQHLLKSGLWTALRARPFSKVPRPEDIPHSLFVTAIDTNPLAVEPQVVLRERSEEFRIGVNLLSKLAQQRTHVCASPLIAHGLKDTKFYDRVKLHEFKGPHPAGLPGTHIHMLEPAGPGKQVWHLNYQDVVAIAAFFLSGRLQTERVIAMAGPQLEEPRLVRTRLGADLQELMAGELKPKETRIVSGSVFGGHTAAGAEAYLGRYHLQVTAIREGRERPLLGYLSPGADRHSVMGIYVSQLHPGSRFDMTSSTQGSERAMVPIGAYEKVMPLDILPTQLLRALIVGDIETAQNLGALELDEEDLALCSYVCPGKYEYGPILRENLTRIEKEG